MQKLSSFNWYFHHSLRFLTLLFLLLSGAGAAAASESGVSKILIADAAAADYLAEISNTGTINALDRLSTSTTLSPAVKKLAMEEVLTGAAASGKLTATSLVSGDAYYALDVDTGLPIVVVFTGTEFRLPTESYGFTKWHIPGGSL